MSHPDDGTIQMLLDGELDPGERARLASHLDGCASCAARVAEARGIMEEADRLVEMVVVPPRTSMPARAPRRRVLLRTLAWAASIVVAVGIGYYGRGTPTLPPAPQPVASSASPEARAREEPSAARPAPVAEGDAAPVPAAKSERKATAEPAMPSVADRQPAAAAPPAAEQEMRDAATREAAKAAAPAVDAAFARARDESGWRAIPMEEGVRLLGGQIRLIDGLTPDGVEAGPGTAVPGADATLPVVRVRYASGAIALDQQRPLVEVGARRAAASANTPGEAAAGRAAAGWAELNGIRFVVTGSVTPESLQTLGGLVR